MGYNETLDGHNEALAGLLNAVNNLPGSAMPTGSIIFHAAATSPDGFLVCDGSEISRAEYAELFNVIGTLYGEGDGSSTFLLPDLRSAFIRGWDNGKGIDSDREFGTLQDGTKVSAGLITSTAYLDGGTSANRICNSGSSASYATGTVRPYNIALLPCIKY